MKQGTFSRYALGKGVTAGPPTLANKLKKLERQVAKNKPELLQFRYNDTIANTVVGTNVFNIDISDDLTKWGSFRDNVTGDKWVNRQIHLNCFTEIDLIECARLVVYMPKNAFSIWSPSTGFEFVDQPDISAFKVLHDKIVYPNSSLIDTVNGGGSRFSCHAKVNMNNTTVWNSSSGNFEKNRLRAVLIYSTPQDVANIQFNYGYSYLFTNK